MTKEELVNDYIDWMYNLVCTDLYSKKTSYHKLFACLYETDFYYLIPMDGNRAEDGVDLRYRYGREFGLPESLIATYLDDRPCSVLEVMMALSIRCETSIMTDPDVGDRVGQWFWEMIVSLGLGGMTDDNFSRATFRRCMDRFLERDYKPNGKGGLFTISDRSKDMRNVEIWYQMAYYLDEILGE